MITTVFVYVGLLLLLLLAIQDFRVKVIKNGHIIQYYACLSLFVALNLIIYIAICDLLLQVPLPKMLIGQGMEHLKFHEKSLPLVLAFAYFGIGTINIPIGDKAISFYGSMLKLFQGMYKGNNIDIDPIKKDIHRLDSQSDKLREAIENFNNTGQAKGWNILSEKWEGLAQDRNALESHSKSLQIVNAELHKPDPLDMEKVLKRIDDKIHEITQEINDKLRRHISLLVEANENNPNALQNLLNAIGLTLPDPPNGPKCIIFLCRAIVFSLFGGAMIGAVRYRFLETACNFAPEMLAWMLALTLAFSQRRPIKRCLPLKGFP